MGEEESIGYNPSKKDCGYKITCITDGKFLNLFTYTARKHDLSILKEKKDDFAEKLEEETVIAEGYVSKDFEKWRGETLDSSL